MNPKLIISVESNEETDKVLSYLYTRGYTYNSIIPFNNPKFIFLNYFEDDILAISVQMSTIFYQINHINNYKLVSGKQILSDKESIPIYAR